MKKLLFFIFALNIYSTLAQVKTWELDRAHTGIVFNVSHMVISEVTGYFREFEGSLSAGKEDFSDAKTEITIKTSSINTDNEARDKHLKSSDFFDAEKFPLMTFKSKSFSKTGESTYDIIGELTIKGIAKEVALKAKLNGIINDPYGNTRAGWKAITIINRFDYGLTWNNVMETGGLVVGKEVNIIINAEFIKKK